MIKRNFVNTFIHNSEKKTIPICLSIFFKYNIKSQFMFTICSCLNYIFLLIFAHVTDNQAWKQINRRLSRPRKLWKSIFKVFMFHERLKKLYHEHLSVVYTIKLSWNTYFMNTLKEIFYSVSSPLETCFSFYFVVLVLERYYNCDRNLQEF